MTKICLQAIYYYNLEKVKNSIVGKWVVFQQKLTHLELTLFQSTRHSTNLS